MSTSCELRPAYPLDTTTRQTRDVSFGARRWLPVERVDLSNGTELLSRAVLPAE